MSIPIEQFGLNDTINQMLSAAFFSMIFQIAMGSSTQSKSNPEYKLFIDHVTKYEREGENKNKKDAIDGLCSAASILKIKYKNFLYA